MVFIGKVESINKGAHFLNAVIMIHNKKIVNIKLKENEDTKIQIGSVYHFEVEEGQREGKLIYLSKTITPILDVDLTDKELDKILSEFFAYAPISYMQMKKDIESYLSKIKNPILHAITKQIYSNHLKSFYIHPAATKFHHAHTGGLAFHTLTMLKLADSFIPIYPFLNKDLLYSSIILHDISKIREISGVEGEYTKEGLLLGHIVMGTNEVLKASEQLGYQDTEEVLLLKHSIVSHHGLMQYGSPKRPQSAESLVLWQIDTIDSKLTELGNALSETRPGEFTQSINVLDKTRFYKHKL